MFSVTPSHDSRAALVKNEGIKLTATYVNTVAASVFAVGGLAPIFSALYVGVPGTRPIVVFTVSIVCCFVSAVLYTFARRILTQMVKP